MPASMPSAASWSAAIAGRPSSRQGNLKGDGGKQAEIVRRTQEIAAFLEAQNMVKDFGDDLFGALVELIKVLSPTHLLFELKNGLVIEQKFIKRKGIHGIAIEGENLRG